MKYLFFISLSITGCFSAVHQDNIDEINSHANWRISRIKAQCNYLLQYCTNNDCVVTTLNECYRRIDQIESDRNAELSNESDRDLERRRRFADAFKLQNKPIYDCKRVWGNNYKCEEK